MSKDELHRHIVAGDEITGLDGRPQLDLAALNATERIVSMAGIHPYIKLLDEGADVIIGGRSSDCAIFAAPAIRQGFPEGLAYFYGKVLECASFCAEPYGGKESVLGEITMEDVKITALLPEQRCTIASVAGHAMYERANPFYEHFLGGHIDMSRCFPNVCHRGPRSNGAAQLRVGKDEIDRLILRTESGRTMQARGASLRCWALEPRLRRPSISLPADQADRAGPRRKCCGKLACHATPWSSRSIGRRAGQYRPAQCFNEAFSTVATRRAISARSRIPRTRDALQPSRACARRKAVTALSREIPDDADKQIDPTVAAGVPGRANDHWYAEAPGCDQHRFEIVRLPL